MNDVPLLSPQRDGFDRRGVVGFALRLRHEQHPARSRQEVRPSVRALSRFHVSLGQRLGGTARCVDHEETGLEARGEHDAVVVEPRATPSTAGLRQLDRRAAGDADFLERARGEEADPVAGGREERSVRTLGAGDGARLATGQVAHIELRRRPRPRHPRQPPPVP